MGFLLYNCCIYYTDVFLHDVFKYTVYYADKIEMFKTKYHRDDYICHKIPIINLADRPGQTI